MHATTANFSRSSEMVNLHHNNIDAVHVAIYTYYLFLKNAVESSDDILYHKPVQRAHILESGSESDCCVSIHPYNTHVLLHNTYAHVYCWY